MVWTEWRFNLGTEDSETDATRNYEGVTGYTSYDRTVFSLVARVMF